MRQSWTLVADATLGYFSGRLQVGLGSASPRIMRKYAWVLQQGESGGLE
jgi:hypothetical protein